MNEHDFTEILMNLLAEDPDENFVRVETFEEGGVLTMNAGLVVTLADEYGSQFQITVVKSN